MSSEYVLEAPISGLNAFAGMTAQLKADAVASAFLLNATAQIACSLEFSAKLAGAAVKLNAPSVLSIEINGFLKGVWHERRLESYGALIHDTACSVEEITAATTSRLSDFKSSLTALTDKTNAMSNRASELAAYSAHLEG